jgi:hypothetical protein
MTRENAPLSAAVVVLATAVCATAVLASTLIAAQKYRTQTAPEAFRAQVQSRTATGALASTIRLQVDRYTPEADRKTMTEAIAHGGYAAFLEALRKAPAVGYVQIEDVKVPVRWARELKTPQGRDISLVTDAPVYFVGGGAANPKSREGFELAVVRLMVDEIGLGSGTMAAAARVKPDGAGGVVIEDYATETIKLTSVSRVIP